jgi:hypothetical protein
MAAIRQGKTYLLVFLIVNTLFRNGFATELGHEFDREKVVAQISTVTPTHVVSDLLRQKMSELRDEISALIGSIQQETTDKKWVSRCSVSQSVMTELKLN